MKTLFAVLGIALLGALLTYFLPREEGSRLALGESGTAGAIFYAEPRPEADIPDGPAAAARQDLANRLGATPDEIEVIRATGATWNTTCLGLPGPGEGCAQAIIPGYEITLARGDAFYTYRTDTTGTALRLVEN